MFLRKMKNKKTGRTYLSIVHNYRDKKTKKIRLKTIKSLGYLDELEKQCADPIAHFKKEIKHMNQERAAISINIEKGIRIELNETNHKNIGYASLSKIYHELGIHTFLKNRQRHTKSGYDVNNIMKLLVFSRLLYPGSKKKTFENKDLFFRNTNFSLDDMCFNRMLILKRVNSILRNDVPPNFRGTQPFYSSSTTTNIRCFLFSVGIYRISFSLYGSSTISSII